MTKIETIVSNVGMEVRRLRDDELDVATGGFINDDGCVRYPTVLQPSINPQPTWTFVDVFSHPTIG